MKHPERIMTKIVSELAMTHALLNCLIKEFALPADQLVYQWPDEIDGLRPESCLSGVHRRAVPALIQLSPKHQLFVLVDRRSSFGSQRYLSDVYVRNHNQGWINVSFDELAHFMLDACAFVTGTFNKELFEQVLSGQQLVSRILDHQNTQTDSQPFMSYINSEQHLLFGHPSHPAPKARLWPKNLSEESSTPEFQANTFLHRFEVPLAGMHIKANGLNHAEALAGMAPQADASAGNGMISMHPIQAALFKQDKRVQALLATGQIIDQGMTSFAAQPTASIRTWYVENHDYFIKGSLHVRITNCVRKNAWYELESALIVDKVFKYLAKHSANTLDGALIAAEPAMLSWSPEHVGEEDQQWFREQTGVILRENFCKINEHDHFVLAATAFARNDHLQPMIWSLIGANASNEMRLQWFDQYQSLLLNPTLSLFFNHGIVTEPHLQNTVFTHQNGMPDKLLLRDFEGVKLTRDKGVSYVAEPLHPRVEASLVYSREQGWNRIMYCLFINNLSEAVLALSWDKPELAEPMWDLVKQQLLRFQIRFKQSEFAAPAPELDALIHGDSIACKCNLKVRLAANADKKAGYVQLKAPWLQEVTCA